jgi:hypothetical protein
MKKDVGLMSSFRGGTRRRGGQNGTLPGGVDAKKGPILARFNFYRQAPGPEK